MKSFLVVLLFSFSLGALTYPSMSNANTYADNLRTCLGGYSTLCKHGILTAEHAQQVKKAEYRKKQPAVRSRAPINYASPEFNGYPCTNDCSGHEAGYEWAEVNSISDPDDCNGNSNSFNEGCQSYAEEQASDEDE